MLPKSRFSKPIFGHSAGSTKLDRPYCKRFPIGSVFSAKKPQESKESAENAKTEDSSQQGEEGQGG